MKIRLTLLSLLILTHLSGANGQPAQPETVMLANTYHPDSNIPLGHYRMSEKLDGIRGIWNGERLSTRSGETINAPAWFLHQLPPFPVEGELWAGRGNFHLVQQTILDQTPNQTAWHHISFMLFDIPFGLGPYHQRYHKIEQWLSEQADTTSLQLIRQYPLNTADDLNTFLLKITQMHGEGVMLRNWYATYRTGRSDTLLKLKPYIDDEAQVIGYKPGQGKYQHQVGALWVRNRHGTEFFIGSGLSERQRASPPPVGTWITYRYDRLTEKGKPRFPRLLRER